jgi:glycine/D-amino acid oxidase-like deaminating enzyme
MVVRRSAALHAAKYTQGLATAAARAGAVLIGGVEMRGIAEAGDAGARYAVQTSRGRSGRARLSLPPMLHGRGDAVHRRRLVPWQVS